MHRDKNLKIGGNNCLKLYFAELAQLVERKIRNLGVGGSSPLFSARVQDVSVDSLKGERIKSQGCKYKLMASA